MSDFRTLYCLGFVFNTTRDLVLLINKNRPAWQAGKLNGIGGLVNFSETPIQAMERKCREETGLRLTGWEPVVNMHFGSEVIVSVFRTIDVSIYDARQIIDEVPVIVHRWQLVDCPVIPNLHWLIPLCLDPILITEPRRWTLGGHNLFFEGSAS